MAAPTSFGVQLTDMNSPVSTSDTVFGEGFATPWKRKQEHVPWETVQDLLSMARDALIAKQRAAEALLQEIDQVKKASDDSLLQRAHRAEVDSGLLLDELQALIQAKSTVAQQRADLDRANALLMAERELLCEQLDVSPMNTNLCQAVQKVLGAARRARSVEVQLRLLARCQRELLLQLEATREEGARAGRHWQACEQVYLNCLAAHGIPKPELPPPLQAAHSTFSMCSSGGSGTSSGVGQDSHCNSGGGSSSSSAVAYCQLLQRLSSGSGSGLGCSSAGASSAGVDIGSPGSHVHLLPATPPASDLNVAAAPRMRRSHSLDSGLNSLTGLLDQLALGQLGSDEGCEYEYDDHERDSESWMLVDSMSDEPGSGSGGGSNGSSGGATATAAAAALLMLGGHQQQQALQLQQKQLQPVQEGSENQDASEQSDLVPAN